MFLIGYLSGERIKNYVKLDLKWSNNEICESKVKKIFLTLPSQKLILK